MTVLLSALPAAWQMAHGYVASFQVTLYNLNYGQATDKTGLTDEKQAFNDEKTGLQDKNQAFEDLLTGLGFSTPELMRKLKEAKFIESAKGRGKYKFVEPQE